MGDFKSFSKVNTKPFFVNANWEEVSVNQKKECGNCKSINTICIYHAGAGSIIGYYCDEEYFCKDCGKYTVYEEEYES